MLGKFRCVNYVNSAVDKPSTKTQGLTGSKKRGLELTRKPKA